MKGARPALTLLGLLAVAVLIDAALLAMTGAPRIFDPYLVLVVWFATQGRRRTRGLLGGGLIGLAQDSLGSAVFGIHYLAKVVIGYGVARASERLIPGEPLTWAVLLAGATLVETLVYLAMGFLLGQGFEARSVGEISLLLVVNTVLGTVVLGAARSWGRRKVGGHAARARR